MRLIDSWPFVIVLGVLAWLIFTWGDESAPPAPTVGAKPFVFENPETFDDVGALLLKLGKRLVVAFESATDEASAKKAARDIESLLPAFAAMRQPKFSEKPAEFINHWEEKILAIEEEVGTARESSLENREVAAILKPVLERLDDLNAR